MLRSPQWVLGLCLMILSLAGASQVALAIDTASSNLFDRWSVVGVIAGGHGKSVAVLRHNASKRTFTLSIGDNLPSEDHVALKQIHGRDVTVASDKESVVLAFAEASAEEPPVAPSDNSAPRTSRFLDAYYRGLRESSEGLILGGNNNENEPEGAPQRRFPSAFDEARSRFEMYRADRAYRLNEAEGGSGTVVNYEAGEDESAASALSDEGDENGGMLPPPPPAYTPKRSAPVPVMTEDSEQAPVATDGDLP